MSFGGETFQTSPLYPIGQRVKCVDRSSYYHNKPATIVGRDGMGSYDLKFDEAILNEVKLETRAYWELELL